AELELERDTAMESVSDRKYFNHKEFVADLDMIALEIEAANARVSGLSQQVQSLETRRASMVIRAPFDGRVVSVNQIGNVMVFRNQQLLTLEKLEVPTVTAFLDQDQVLEIGLADRARVYVPALGQHINAQVYKIDRNSAFLDPKASHYTWTDSKGKSAAVSLRLDVRLEQMSEVRAGLPVVVVFAKRSTNSVMRQVTDWMGQIRKERVDGTSI
ncbi:MAG: HlyD family efflux transporter periplasmic adaptor subunit, partial [Pseudomonadota bacterium]